MGEMYDFEWILTDNSAQVEQIFNGCKAAALEEIGLRAEQYAKKNAPVGTPTSTGIKGYRSNGLRKSITHKVVGDSVYIGTNQTVTIDGRRVHYPVYVELGTGVYATDGKGRKSPWVWVDKNGKPHFTRGMKPRHFLKKAATEHVSEYRNIVLRAMKRGLPMK